MLSLTIFSCRKGIETKVEENLPSAPENNERKALLIEVKDLLKETYKNPNALKEVNAAIRTKYYWDEQVLLRDLLNPDKSLLYQRPGMLQITKGSFARTFSALLNSNKYPQTVKYVASFSNAASNTRTASGESDAVAIYFPYSENFPGEPASPTLVAATIDADSGPGEEPYTCDAGTCYQDVIVDDEYAQDQPVNIIQLIDPNDPGLVYIPPATSQNLSTAIDTTIITGAGLQDTVRQVFIGKAMLKRNYDALISFTKNGGGSEIVFCRASGYLQMNTSNQVNQNQNFDRVAATFSRGEIEGVFTFAQLGLLGIAFNDPRWKTVNTQWDNDWKPQNFEQVFAIYEEDNRGEITTSGTLSTTLDSLGIPVRGSLSWNFKRTSQDNWLRQSKISYAGYLAYLLSPPICKTQDGYPIMDCGADISYTMPLRVAIFR